MSKVKNQHFVPRFYLKNFTNPKGKIYAFDLQTRESFGTSVDNVAQRKFFYDFEPLDQLMGDQFIEKTMGEFENESVSVFKKIIDLLKNGSLKDQSVADRITLAEYILIQMTRTYESRVLGEHFAKEFERQLKAKGLSEPILKANKLDAASYDAKKHQIYGFLSPDMEDRIRSLCDRYWIFYDNQTKHKFYTSDHPVVGHIHERKSFGAYEIYFPLTPRFALSILLKKEFPEFAKMDNQIVILSNPENIKFYNSLILTNCNRQIYSCENDFRLAEKILKQHPFLSDPNKQRVDKK